MDIRLLTTAPDDGLLAEAVGACLGAFGGPPYAEGPASSAPGFLTACGMILW